MSKIALLFFVHSHFHFEEEWRRWLEGFETDQVLVKIVVQRTDTNTNTNAHAHSEWVHRRMVTVNANYITEGNPAWKSMDKLVHMHRVLAETVAEGCTHALTLGDHCLPVVSARRFWEEVTTTTSSWIDVQLRPRNGYTALNQFTRIPGSVCKGDRYMLLVLDDIRTVVESEEGLHPYSHAKYAEEMYVPTTLMRLQALRASAVLTPEDAMDAADVRAQLRETLGDAVMAERVCVHTRDTDGVAAAIDITARERVDDPSADDIALAITNVFSADVCYGRVRSKKVVFSMWNNSHMYPNSYVWDEELVSLSRSHGCLFAQVVIDVDHTFWDTWIATDDYVPTDKGGHAHTVQSDVRFRLSGKQRKWDAFNNDTYTAYRERVWPERECWMYAKHKLTTLS